MCVFEAVYTMHDKHSATKRGQCPSGRLNGSGPCFRGRTNEEVDVDDEHQVDGFNHSVGMNVTVAVVWGAIVRVCVGGGWR